MTKGRLEAFSDGVIAIIITIMVLDLKIPSGKDLAALNSISMVFICYVLSYLFIGIYWSNHHHLLHAARDINGKILWANLHLLFWLSLIPFVTNWMGKNFLAPWPVAVYGSVLLMSAIAYFILSKALIRHNGKDSLLGLSVGKDIKGIVSIIAYMSAIPFSFIISAVAFALYVIVAIIWIIPDKRIEKNIKPA